MSKPKLKTLVEGLAFHLADLLDMDENDDKIVKKYHSLIDEYEDKIRDIIKSEYGDSEID